MDLFIVPINYCEIVCRKQPGRAQVLMKRVVSSQRQEAGSSSGQGLTHVPEKYSTSFS